MIAPNTEKQQDCLTELAEVQSVYVLLFYLYFMPRLRQA